LCDLSEILAKKLRELRDGRRHVLRLVVHVDVRRARNDEQFLRLLGLLVDFLAPEERVGLGPCDDQQRPGRDRVELLKGKKTICRGRLENT
jgi:hypothetical protein